jgi:hypothetical protein
MKMEDYTQPEAEKYVPSITTATNPTYEQLESQNAEHLATIADLQKQIEFWQRHTPTDVFLEERDEHLATIGQLQGRVAELVDALKECRPLTARLEKLISSSQPTGE